MGAGHRQPGRILSPARPPGFRALAHGLLQGRASLRPQWVGPQLRRERSVEDVVMEWPQSREGIRGGKTRREIYSRFPSLPKVTPRRTTGSGDTWALEASLDYGDGDPYQAVFLFQMRDGRIAQEIAYWSKPFPAPEWRAPWIERM